MAEETPTTSAAPESGWRRRLDIVGEYMTRGAITALSTPGLIVDAVNNAPRVLNIVPGVDGMTALSANPFGGSAMIKNALTGAHSAYKDVTGIETPQPQTMGEKALAATAELAGTVALPMVGAAAAPRAAVAATQTPQKIGAIDVLSDILMPVIPRGTTLPSASNAVTNSGIGRLAAAEAAGVTATKSFAARAANMTGEAVISTARTMGPLAAHAAIGTAKVGTQVAAKTAGFALRTTAKSAARHPVVATGVGYDLYANNGNGLKTAAGMAAGAAGLGLAFSGKAAGLMPSLSAPRLPNMKQIEEALGFDIPDTWERTGSRLMNDFRGSSFARWLVNGSMASRMLLGLLAYVMFDNIKDNLIGNGMATNMASLAVGVAAAQMLPQMLERMLDIPANSGPANDTTPRPQPQAMDFAPAAPGGAVGMSFAPAGP